MRQIDLLTVPQHQPSSLALMQSAAKACFDTLAAHFLNVIVGKRALILCGPGNNGGDGAALGIDLNKGGVRVDVVLFEKVDKTKGDARTYFNQVQQLAQSRPISSELSFVECDSATRWKEFASGLSDYDLVVDALFGTGLTRPLDGVFGEVIRDLSIVKGKSGSQRPWVLSVDLPSGLNADLEQLIGPAVEADVTVTFTAAKRANVVAPASHLNGKLVIAQIGSPTSLLEATDSSLFVTEENDAREFLNSTRYAPDSFKNSHGHVLVIAGARGYTGAAVLCGNAAMRAGAGLVTIATPASAQTSAVTTVMPEIMTAALAETDRGAISDQAIDHIERLSAKATVVAIGPGLSSEDERTRRFVYEVTRRRTTPVVIDADALNCLANYSGHGWPEDLQGSTEFPLILTPHPGEMLRLLGTNDKSKLYDRVAVIRDFATRHRLILILKGSGSLIAAPDGRVFINPTGNAGLGTAGSGDTLTGIVASFIAQSSATQRNHLHTLEATIAALYVGGLAGDLAARELGMRTMVASDIREHLSAAILSLDPEGEMPQSCR